MQRKSPQRRADQGRFRTLAQLLYAFIDRLWTITSGVARWLAPVTGRITDRSSAAWERTAPVRAAGRHRAKPVIAAIRRRTSPIAAAVRQRAYPLLVRVDLWCDQLAGRLPGPLRPVVNGPRRAARVVVAGGHRIEVFAAIAVLVAGLITVAVTTTRSGDQPTAVNPAAVGADQARRGLSGRADRARRPTPTVPATPGAAVAPPAPSPKPAWVSPMLIYRLTSCYGYRTDPYPQAHEGIDFANVAGTPVLAAAAGTVISAGWNNGGYGNMVIIYHGGDTWTLYGHTRAVAVAVGQHVEAGQQIAWEGSTGDSTGPHLHFEVWNAMWSRINPAPFLRAHGVALPGC